MGAKNSKATGADQTHDEQCHFFFNHLIKLVIKNQLPETQNTLDDEIKSLIHIIINSEGVTSEQSVADVIAMKDSALLAVHDGDNCLKNYEEWLNDPNNDVSDVPTDIYFKPLSNIAPHLLHNIGLLIQSLPLAQLAALETGEAVDDLQNILSPDPTLFFGDLACVLASPDCYHQNLFELMLMVFSREEDNSLIETLKKGWVFSKEFFSNNQVPSVFFSTDPKRNGVSTADLTPEVINEDYLSLEQLARRNGGNRNALRLLQKYGLVSAIGEEGNVDTDYDPTWVYVGVDGSYKD